MNQLQPLYFQIKNLYTSREEPAQMYHWSIFIFATAITEILASMITGTLFFIPWYFAVGFRNGMIDPNGRGAYMYILFVRLPLLFRTHSLHEIENADDGKAVVRNMGLNIRPTPRCHRANPANSRASNPNGFCVCCFVLRRTAAIEPAAVVLALGALR